MHALELSSRRIFKLVGIGTQELRFGEVRIKTAYAGLSFTDIIIKKGLYKYQKLHMPTPYVPGFEATGTISEIGQRSSFKVGDTVAVLKRSGCFSEEIIARESEVILLPKDTNLEWACSLLVNFFTAFHALNNIIVIQPGSRILITSAGGGVGGILTQLALRNHHVTSLVGGLEKKQYVKTLGSDEVHQYSELNTNEKFDIIFTANGNLFRKFRKMLNPNGKIVLYGFHDMVPNTFLDISKTLWNYLTLSKIDTLELVYKNQTVTGFNTIQLGTNSKEFLNAREAFLEEVFKKALVKHKIHTFPLTSFDTAFEKLAEKNHIGKILFKFL